MSDSTRPTLQPNWGLGVALGIGIGMAMGAALRNFGVGLALGVGIGVAFALAFGTRSDSDAPPADDPEPPVSPDAQERPQD